MSDVKHTPGPWTINPTGRSPMIGYDVDDGGPLLPIVDVVSGYDSAMIRANALLIAAAPTLLCALKKFVAAEEAYRRDVLDRQPENYDDPLAAAYAEAVAVIAQAEGCA